MKKLLLVVMMLCLAHSAFAWTWRAVVEAKKDDGSWKYTAKEIFDVAIEQKRGFYYRVCTYAAQIGRSDIIKVLLTEKPGTNQTYGEIINSFTERESELGRDDRFIFDVSFTDPMRTELQTALYYGQKEAAKDFIKLGANPFKNGRVEDKLHNHKDPGMSTREFAIQGGLRDFFDNVILKMPEVTNNLAKLKREAEIYNEKFKNTPQYAYVDPAEMKMQHNKTIKEMLLDDLQDKLNSYKVNTNTLFAGLLESDKETIFSASWSSQTGVLSRRKRE